jgi:hypothetical protein
MKIKIKVVKDFSQKEQVELEEIGIKVIIGWDDFEIDTDNSNMQYIQHILRSSDWNTISQREALFSEKDRSDAPFINIYSNKMLGYAKPDGDEDEVDDFPYPFDIYPYYKGVFEVKDTDENYGLLKGTQIGSYSLNGEPNWGNKDIASANYIEDTFFVKPEIYNDIFKPLNINCLPVFNYKTSLPLKSVVQLVQQGISSSKLNISKEEAEEIIYVDKWNLKKYVLRNDIYYPSFASPPQSLDFFYTQEYFGDGGINLRNTVISQNLYKILKNNNIKGLNYYPMER